MKLLNLFSLIFCLILALSSPKLNPKNSKSFLKTFVEEPTNETTSEEETQEEESVEPSGEEESVEPSGEEESKEEEKVPEKEETKNEDGKYINVKCLWVNKYDVYSLQKLQNKNKDYVKEFDKGKIIFNLCQNTVSKVGNLKSNSTFLWEKTDGNITQISGSIDGEGDLKNTWSDFTEYENSSLTGIAITFVDGEKCESESTLNHKTIFKLYCDAKISDDDFLKSVNLDSFDKSLCTHVISAKSAYGCPLNSTYLLTKVFQEYKIFFIIFFLILGLFLCYFGHKFVTLTIIIVTGIIGCSIITLCVLNFISSLITTEKSLFILLGVGLVVGVAIGFFLKSAVKCYVVMVGGTLGYSVAIFIYQIIQNYIDWNPEYLYYATVGVCCVIGGILGLCALKAVNIIGTAVLGGYITMRAFTIWFGGYNEEAQIIELFKNQEYEQLKEIQNGWIFAYLGLWVLLSFGGACYQWRGHKNNDGDYKGL